MKRCMDMNYTDGRKDNAIKMFDNTIHRMDNQMAADL